MSNKNLTYRVQCAQYILFVTCFQRPSQPIDLVTKVENKYM